MADREVTLKLNLKPGDSSALRRAFAGVEEEAGRIGPQLERAFSSAFDAAGVSLGALGDKLGRLGDAGALPDFAAKFKELQEPFEQVNKQIDAQEAAFRRLNAAMQPQNLERMVEAEGKLEDAKKRLNKALTEERGRQGVGGDGADLMGRLFGAQGGQGVGGAATGVLSGQGAIGRTFAGATGAGAGAGLGGGAGSVVGLLGSIAPALGPLAPILLGIGAAVAVVEKVANAFGEAIDAAVAKLKEWGKTLLEYAGIAAPATQERLNRSFLDLQATIGRAAVPALNIWTQMVQTFGDFLSSILPSSQEFAEAFAPLKDILKDVRDVLAAVAPLIKELLVSALKSLGEVLKGVAEIIHAIVEKGKEWGLIKPGGKLKTRDFAPGAATYSSLEEYGKQFRQQAFSRGVQDPAKQTAENTQKTAENTERQVTLLEALGEMLSRGPGGATAAAASAGSHRGLEDFSAPDHDGSGMGTWNPAPFFR